MADSSWVTSRTVVLKLSFALGLLLASRPALGAEPGTAPAHEDSAFMSLDELLNTEVVSASRNPSKLIDTAAAVFILTQDDIARSGATTIPDLLRMVPGSDVARIDASRYAVSIRGFNREYSNKLLVMVDGRSVYKPLFGGTPWDLQDMPLENIERIEVVRGPGGSSWGANAMNGVVNIVTKKAQQTQGWLLSETIGTELETSGLLQYGGKISDKAFYRVYAKAFSQDGFEDARGNDTDDYWKSEETGFRIDVEPTLWDTLWFDGQVYRSRSQVLGTSLATTPPSPFYADRESYGGHVLGNWKHVFSERSRTTLQMYYDVTDRDVEQGLQELRQTFDVDFQHEILIGDRHDFSWGLGSRFAKDDVDDNPYITFTPESQNMELYSAFLQDDIALVEEKLFLTLGSKFEYNDYTDWEPQPTARLLAKPSKDQSVWTAVSKAARLPARSEAEGNIIFNLDNSGPQPVIFRGIGQDDVDSEKIVAYEAGYRVQPLETLFIDVAGYYNEYDDLISLEPGPRAPNAAGTAINAPFYASNKLAGESYGGEIALTLKPAQDWNIQAAYDYTEIDLHTVNGGKDVQREKQEDDVAEHQASLRSSHNLSATVQLDFWFRYVDAIESLEVDDYTALDIRLGWKATPDLDLAIVAQNLIAGTHEEMNTRSTALGSTEIEPGVYVKATWTP